MTTFEKHEKDNQVLTIYYDEDADNPREWYNLGTIVGWHRRYNIVDEVAENIELYSSWEEWLENEVIKPNKGQVIYLPVYMYEHGGIALRTYPFSCPWDSGQLGWIYVTKEKVRKEFNCKRITNKTLEKVYKLLENEIEILSNYLNGDVFGFVLEEEGKTIDSCWGFYGSDFRKNGMIDELGEEWQEVV